MDLDTLKEGVIDLPVSGGMGEGGEVVLGAEGSGLLAFHAGDEVVEIWKWKEGKRVSEQSRECAVRLISRYMCSTRTLRLKVAPS